MEGQLTIRKNKRIGTVILIVEGEDEEFKLLKRIFHSILGYTYISINKEGIIREKFENKENGSSILVANTKNSNIKSIETLDYLDRIKATLTNELNRNIKYASIYYIWNRDKDSNDPDITNKLLNIIDNDVYNVN